MKILLTHRPGGAYGHISESWANAFLATGHVVRRWDGSRDGWTSFDPDVYLGCSGHRQPIPPIGERGSAKVAIHVNSYCDQVHQFSENYDAIRWVTQQNPDAVFGYGHESDRRFWANWYMTLGIRWVPMATAGDSVQFSPHLASERTMPICYVGGYWPYKAKSIDAYLIPLARERPDDVFIFGWGLWPVRCRGTPSNEAVPGLLAGALVAPCLSEPHTIEYGIDLPERAFKAALSGAVVVHDPACGIERFMPSAVIGRTPIEFSELCKRWASAPEDERAALAARQRIETLENNTYFHRLAGLLTALGFITEAHGLLTRANCDLMQKYDSALQDNTTISVTG